MLAVSQPSQHAVHVPQLRDGSGTNAVSMRPSRHDRAASRRPAAEGAGGRTDAAADIGIRAPQQRLYRLPLPQGQSSLRGGGAGIDNKL
jgi:hypothetical protein